LSGAALDVALEARQPVAPEHIVFLGPLRNLAQRAGRELVDPLSPVRAPAPFAHESRIAQHAQVARHGGTRHLERRGKLHHRRIPGAELVEDRPPRRIGDGEEGIGVGSRTGHARKNG
jgi:hypothetical protein